MPPVRVLDMAKQACVEPNANATNTHEKGVVCCPASDCSQPQTLLCNTLAMLVKVPAFTRWGSYGTRQPQTGLQGLSAP